MFRSITIIFLASLLCASCADRRVSRTDDALNEIPTPAASHSPSPSVKPTPDVPVFKGDIAGHGGKEKFYNFLENRHKGAVRLDLLLSDDQISDLNSVDKDKRWYFDLSYPDKDDFTVGGELLIDISRGKGSLKLEDNHLQGLIQLTTWDGPHQGLMSVSARPITATGEASPPVAHKPLPGPSKKAAH